jgi:hypothetical protein
LPLEAAVVSITQFHGGSAHNVIPGEVGPVGASILARIIETRMPCQ